MKRIILIPRGILFAIIIGISFYNCTRSAIEEFFNQSSKEYTFSITEARLTISKSGGEIKLFGQDGELRQTQTAFPSFFINKEWVSITKINKVLDETENHITLEALLENGNNITIEIKSPSASSFNLLIKTDNIAADSVRGIVKLQNPEEIYGFGEMWNGHVAQRGQLVTIWDKNGTPDECAYMPYYVSTANYALYINYGGLVTFDVGKSDPDELVYTLPAKQLDMTLVAGISLANAIENYVSLTGLPLAPPRWSYKPWFWLMHDPNQPGAKITTLNGEHFIGMIEKLREMNIPIGVTWMEPPWQNGRTSFIPNPKFSPDLKDLIRRIDAMGVKTLAWTLPYTSPAASNWQVAEQNNYLVRKPGNEKTIRDIKIGPSGELVSKNNYIYLNFFNPEVAAWWQQEVEKAIDLGFKGFKLDGGQSLEKDAQLFNGLTSKEVHNSYALEYNKVYYKALTSKLGEDFLMIPRASYIGSAAYTNSKWPGDLSGSFASNGLPSTVFSSISLAFSGMPFISTDIGGFEGRPCTEEVFVRWSQFGAFLPGMQTMHMPWWYSDRAVNHFRYLAWLHTDLTPYYMSLAFEAKQKGTPVIRPLVWSHQADTSSWRIDDQFTLGNDILIAPILNASAQREVYLPTGVWYNFLNENEVVTGPSKFNWTASGPDSLYSFPIYVREGAIIPMEIKNDVTGFGSPESDGFLTLAIWPKSDDTSRFELNDREDAVSYTCAGITGKSIEIKWSETKINHIFRIHLEQQSLSVTVLSGTENNTLTTFNELTAFQKNSDEGFYYDAANRNVWIRKINDGFPGQITIKID